MARSSTMCAVAGAVPLPITSLKPCTLRGPGLAMDIDPKLLGFEAHAVPVKLKV